MKPALHKKVLKMLDKFYVEDVDYDDRTVRKVKIGKALIVRADEILISAENEHSHFFANYYHFNGYPWISPELEHALDEIGCFLEWKNPGCLSVYEI